MYTRHSSRIQTQRGYTPSKITSHISFIVSMQPTIRAYNHFVYTSVRPSVHSLLKMQFNECKKDNASHKLKHNERTFLCFFFLKIYLRILFFRWHFNAKMRNIRKNVTKNKNNIHSG